MGFKIGKRKYWRSKKTGAAYREGAFSNRRKKRTYGVVADGWMSSHRHDYNRRKK